MPKGLTDEQRVALIVASNLARSIDDFPETARQVLVEIQHPNFWKDPKAVAEAKATRSGKWKGRRGGVSYPD